ncbi:WD40-repeat-containing domain protein, partial [Mycena capillaripes]
VLSTILQLFEPLDSTSLGALLELDPEELNGILLPLSAVIHVPDTSGAAVKIRHLSFREFMMSHVRQEVRCGTESQQQSLTSALLKLMYKELKFNICDLPTSYLQNVDITDLQNRLDKCIPHHLRYACQFWVDHLTTRSYELHNAEAAEKLLIKQFLFWLEVLSLLGMVDCASKALSRLITWSDVVCIDAKSFISFFYEAIIRSAPHIYVSALALAPAESEIGRAFWPQFPHLLSVTKGRVEKWPATIELFAGHTGHVHSVAFSPDSKCIVSGSSDGTVQIWDLKTGVALGEPLVGHTGRVTSVSFSPDGKHIVSGSYDHTVRIWDIRAASVRLLEGHIDLVLCVAFSPHGKQIISSSSDSTVHVWDVETGA